jgi:hypothetical protein
MSSRPEVTGRKVRYARPANGPPALAFSIYEFCASHNISKDFYFKLARQGLGPVIMKIGHRTLISVEAAAEWREEREKATDQRKPAAEAA